MNNMLTAAVFPGQGAQRTGMGKDFFDHVPVSRRTYEEASQALGWDVAALCFEENDQLNLTQYAQPCILTTQIAMFRGLQSLYGFSPQVFAGHSLGEYTALVAAEAIPFTQALKVVQVRGQLMQKAVPQGQGAMAAVIAPNLDAEHIAEALKDLDMDISNINSPGQIVISGQASTIDMAQKTLEKIISSDDLRFVLLNVSAPFHSRFMQLVENAFRNVLEDCAETFVPANACKVMSNFTGGFHLDQKQSLIDNLVFQLSHTVRWTDNMKVLLENAYDIYEIGPDRPLTGFFKTMGAGCKSITKLSAAQRAFRQE